MKISFSRMLKVSLWWIALRGLLLTLPTNAFAGNVYDGLYDLAIGELQRALETEPSWIKIHAAEALISLGIDNRSVELFQEELKRHGAEPQYRIGIWRVLARASRGAKERRTYLNRIRDAYFDKHASDRDGAAESLAKMRYNIAVDEASIFNDLANEPVDASTPYRRWIVAVSGGEEDVRHVAKLLADRDAAVRANAAYALRFLAYKLPADVVSQLHAAAAEEPESQNRVYLISAAFATSNDEIQRSRLREHLLEYAQGGSRPEKYETAAVLGLFGTGEDIGVLCELLRDADADVRVGAANAILCLNGKKSGQFETLDWFVLGAYALGMMAIGWLYSNAASGEEYLLGGRQMKPWAVGISLFATLMSTLTYLAYPGEMVRHGPMILSSILAYPLVFIVVGRIMIPYIMRLKVTSAYEILELRFGLSVRLLGSSIFLILRLFWMSLIVYATSDAVLVPLMGLSSSATPWVCVVLAMITVAYTSMGGLRAVVVTDVIQTAIMLVGAILSLVLITHSLGGVAEWWPQTWSGEWDEPSFFFAPESRTSMGMVILSVFIWYVCTAGSDQMAIQRYLSTKDAAAARQMFGISLLCDAGVTLLLAGLGLALFAYFNAHYELLPQGETVSSSADKLLPLFIVKALPAGLSGLLVAGILSAAMDSLSSGLNSSALVIVEDWINRFRNSKPTDREQVRQAKIVSLVLGLIVITISLATVYVPGNLLEICFRVVNLLTAPLFVLFFFAMFVPWATVPGTWIGGLASVAAAVAVAYSETIDLSFIWIMPVALLTGILVGGLISLLPIGMSRPMLKMSDQPTTT